MSTDPVSSPVSAAKPTMSRTGADAVGRQLVQDVGVLGQLEVWRAAVGGLLDLGAGGRDRPEVCGCRGHHHGVGAGRSADNGVPKRRSSRP